VKHELWSTSKVGGYGHGSDGKGGGWAGLKQVVLVRSTRQYLAKPGAPPSVEDHHYLTSLCAQSPQGAAGSMLSIAREHWQIENGLHHKKDRTMREDDQRAKRGASVMSRCRSLALGILRLVEGASTAMKQITVSSNPAIALALLNLQPQR
jgi:hypothetical protein